MVSRLLFYLKMFLFFSLNVSYGYSENCLVNDIVHLSAHNMILWRNKLISNKSYFSLEVFVEPEIFVGKGKPILVIV